MNELVSAVLERLRTPPAKKARTPWLRDITKVTWFFAAVIVAALLALWHALPRASGAPLLWGLGMLTAGAVVGFLFGHPQVARGAPPAKPPGSDAKAPDATAASGDEARTRPSTALEEISDWLTKMVVGIGLVQLKELPSSVLRLGTLVSRSVPDMKDYPAQSLGNAIVVFFTSIGFVYGYLATRLYIQGAIDRADGELRNEFEEYKEGQDTLMKSLSKVAAAAVVASAGAMPTDAASTQVELWDQDPNKGRFGGAANSNGRVLEATLDPAFPGKPELEACWVKLTVRSTDAARPLTGSVVFHLHPTYDQRIVTVPVDASGEAHLTIQAWGVFTVGAVTDGDTTRLELDLKDVAGAPPAFYQA